MGSVARPRDLVVRFASDVRDFLRGTDQVERALSDTERDLKATTTVGEREAADLARAYKRAGDKMGQDAHRTHLGTKQEFAEAGSEAGAEFAQNIGEAISSGDLSGVLSGSLGGLVGTFGAGGPIGLAIAGLGAAAVGVFGSIQASAQQTAQRVSDLFDAIIDDADTQAQWDSFLTDKFGSRVEGIKTLASEARKAGVPLEDFRKALLGDADANDRVRAALHKYAGEYHAAYGPRGSVTKVLTTRGKASQDLLDQLDQEQGAYRAAKSAAEDYTRSLRGLTAAAADYAKAGSSYARGGSTYNSQVPAAARRRIP